MLKNKKFYQAVAVMTGYIIGVGMFSLPFLFHKSGIYAYFFFILLLLPAQYILHLIYANLIIVTKNFHRLPGYTEIYLGKKGKAVVFFAKVFGNYGALIAYIIVTGLFMNELLSPIFGGSEIIYGSIIFFIEAFIVYFGINIIARAELFITSLLLLVVLWIAFKGVPMIDVNNYGTIEWKYLLLPYGAMLFSMDGNGSLPIVAKILKKDKRKIKAVIRTSMVLSTVITAIFMFVVLGVTGDATTKDALTGLNNTMNGLVVALALVFGIFSLITSFLGVAESIRETLWWDFKINKTVSWAFAVFVPYGFYLLGVHDLIKVISIVGAICGGLCGITLLIIFEKLMKENKLPMFNVLPGKIITRMLALIFISGILYEIFYFITKA